MWTLIMSWARHVANSEVGIINVFFAVPHITSEWISEYVYEKCTFYRLLCLYVYKLLMYASVSQHVSG